MRSQALKERLLITISGPAGSGKSHCALALAETFDLPYHSAGSIFRRLAKERGVTIEDFTKLAEKDEGIDSEIDQRTEALAKEGGAILDGRLVDFFSPYPNKISFYLTAPLEERVKRIAEREGIPLEDARKRTLAREEGERRRYLKIYRIDVRDISRYDFVINTAKWDKVAIINLLKSIVELYVKTKSPNNDQIR